METRTATESDWDWIIKESEPIGGAQVVSLGVLHSLKEHEAIVAIDEGEPMGFAVYRLALPSVELLGLGAMRQWDGTGTQLMLAMEARVKRLGCKSIFLCTTNDNLSAVRFYQRRGYHLKELNVDEFRNILAIKGYDPDIRVIGQGGIAIKDEIVLEKTIQ